MYLCICVYPMTTPFSFSADFQRVCESQLEVEKSSRQRGRLDRPPSQHVDVLAEVSTITIIVIVLTITITIIVTRPKPPYGRQGLAGLWGKDTVRRVNCGVFSTSHFAPSSYWIELISTNGRLPWKNVTSFDPKM